MDTLRTAGTVDPGLAGALDRAAEIVAGGGVLVLTGAGISTDSGIPDYRGPGSSDRRPMSYQDFVGDPAARQRYWARSHVGWRRMARARPNAGHAAVAALESAGAVDAVVTQNVDRLHTAAGSRRVVDLHGRIDEVACLGCGAVTARDELDRRLSALNPGWADRAGPEAGEAPDGDAVVGDVSAFRTADCAGCGGVLKPHLVFFGESVPRARVELCCSLVDRARALLVAGSSLTVFSGRRFVVRARRRGLPVVIVNRGPTRCDADLVPGVDVRVEGGCAEVLGALAAATTGVRVSLRGPPPTGRIGFA
ncbi:MAG: NAD-dependent protein deacetylase [Kineosporiaceae bacterium]